MNKLVLVGNGFDLAHGMKTAYNDFILWYIKKGFSEYLQSGKYSDELMDIDSGNLRLFKSELGNRSIAEYVDGFYEKDDLNKLLQNRRTRITFGLNGDTRRRPEVPFKVRIKSTLLSKIIDHCSISKWVEIENLFYDELKLILQDSNQSKQEDVRKLNLSIKYIISQLELYLSSITIGSAAEYQTIFTNKVNTSDIVGLISDPFYERYDTLVLNFNYTETVEKYIDKEQIIYIHGELNNISNPVIFGFGDELDADYVRLELSKTKDIFNYIKSFWYFKTSNYHNLIRFIQSNKFQVCILGHSCGLSDRTMLNMIFEHENCISIKIYYYEFPEGGNNYTELTQEISRHFKNKQTMRMKIVPFDKSSPMPQHQKLAQLQLD
ncbi:AbiH family protein [Pedobacter nyackensis]|uniref:Bacteriophage abortive infection AbiH n=1 Tax=Pedobacter nyackensis TaxID=475255 RepID=A0A1W2A0M6_9SPHI|nr:AbiH family protein [Pedobacter nyackensis]SMC53951.1 Bacteriophage abortive infection AbiH [Pedobacter nyackensis]